jgi:hypothetical protein
MEDFSDDHEREILEPVCAAYSRYRWVYIPKFIAADHLPAFITETLASTSRRVTVGLQKYWWTEYAIDRASGLGSLLTSEQVHTLAEKASGRELSRNTSIWAQAYHVGERIAWHRDGAGEIQLLVCLQATAPECGGAFCLRADRKQETLNLKAGDAILFKASQLPHSTTVICLPTAHTPSPRVTAVARFFLRTEPGGCVGGVIPPATLVTCSRC